MSPPSGTPEHYRLGVGPERHDARRELVEVGVVVDQNPDARPVQLHRRLLVRGVT
jgi:hypothetical protein